MGQSILTVFVIERTLARLVPNVGFITKFGVLSMLALATSLPWFTGQVMADFFAPVMVFALYLAAVEHNSLTKWEYYTLLLIPLRRTGFAL